MFGFFLAPKICWGTGALQQLSALGAQRVALFVDPALAEGAACRRAIEEFAKTETTVDVVRASGTEPALEELEELSDPVRRLAPDWIVALGGGSTIDAAKGVWIRYERPELGLETISPLVELGLRVRARFVAIPSTSGSGSEAAWTARFRSRDDGWVEVASRDLVPDWSILDPAIPRTMPPAVTLDSGVDALAHAFEAIASEWSNPFSTAAARDAIGTIVTELPKVARHPDDEEARAAVHYAATLAGLAVANAQVGVAHALADAVGPEAGLTHGRAVGILLPYVLEFNFPSAREKYLTLAGVLGPGPVQNRSALADRIRILYEQLGFPKSFASAGPGVARIRDAMAPLAERARRGAGAIANPRVPSASELEHLLGAALEGGPVPL